MSSLNSLAAFSFLGLALLPQAEVKNPSPAESTAKRNELNRLLAALRS